MRRFWVALTISLSACGGEAPPVAAPTPLPSASATEVVVRHVPTPTEESARALAEAKAMSDPKQRCRLLQEAVLLDGASYEARLARASSRCTSSRLLLDDARAALALKSEPAAARTLAIVATRAESAADALAAAAVLARGKGELDDIRLAARTFARFADHASAAKTFDAIVEHRMAQGASVDALEARIDAFVERAKAKETPGPKLRDELVAVSTSGSKIFASYGTSWIGDRVVEALAALREADPVAATEARKKLEQLPLLRTASGRRAMALERAIGDARGFDRRPLATLVTKERLGQSALDPSARAALAVLARAGGNCAVARAHARAAHALEDTAGAHFGGDVAWAESCGTTNDRGTLLPPRPSAMAEDARAIAEIDSLRARAELHNWVEAHPDDVSALLTLLELERPEDRRPVAIRAAKLAPNDPIVLMAFYDAARPVERRDQIEHIVEDVILRSVEVEGDPRAAAPLLARVVLGSLSDPGFASSYYAAAEGLLRACEGKRGTASCLPLKQDAPALPLATALLRSARARSLARLARNLGDADLDNPRVRLDAIIANLTIGDRAAVTALLRRSAAWGPEAALAHALADGCKVAKMREGDFEPLKVDYRTEIAQLATKCP